jgi:type VI secretion system protein ImpH
VEARAHTVESRDDAPRSSALEEFFGQLAEAAFRFDLYYALRRIEAMRPDLPLLGRAPRPVDEAVRLGQEPSLAFAPSAIAALDPARDGIPPRIVIHGFGLFGKRLKKIGVLALHRTLLANSGELLQAKFSDGFQHLKPGIRAGGFIA